MSMISVIVPAYNVAKYLPACIRSILRQRYKDFELILVDDGSPDGSGEICDAFAKKDSRVRVIHQANGGVSRARNEGIRASRGEWICFIDADDIVSPSFLEYFHMEDVNTSDLIIQGWRNLENGRLGEKYRLSTRRYTQLKDALIPSLLTFRGPVCKLFKKALLDEHRLRFPDGIAYAEDAVFYYEYLAHCSVIQTYDSCRYFYRHDRADSASCLRHDPFMLLEAKEKSLALLYSLFQKCQMEFPYPKREDIVELKGMLCNLAHFRVPYSVFGRFLRRVRQSKYLTLDRYKPDGIGDLVFIYMIRFLPLRLVYMLFREYLRAKF